MQSAKMDSTSSSEECDDRRAKSIVRRPKQTYQHYVDHFEELCRQSPLAKVILKDIFPQSSQPRTPEVTSLSKLFRVPITPTIRQKPTPLTKNVVMSPVAKLIHQMKTQGALKQGPGAGAQGSRSWGEHPHSSLKEKKPSDDKNVEDGREDMERLNGPSFVTEDIEDDGVTAREKGKSSLSEAKANWGSSEDCTNENWSDTPTLKEKKVTVLDQWIIKWLGSGHKYIAVEGHRLEDSEGSFWHSTAITRRISNRILETSGSRYKLVGSIHRLLTIDQGFSPNFVQHFKMGFPPNWKSLLQQEATRQSSQSDDIPSSVGNTDTELPVGKKPSASSSQRVALSRQCKKKAAKGIYPLDANRADKENQLKQQRSAKTKEKKPVISKNNLNMTPIYVTLDSVKKTQSGRKIIPPLQYWSGQRQRSIDALDGTIEIIEGSVDYTPVSATRVRLKGSVQISDRERRMFKRSKACRIKGHHPETKSRSCTNTASQSDGTEDESVGPDSATDGMTESEVKVKYVCHRRKGATASETDSEIGSQAVTSAAVRRRQPRNLRHRKDADPDPGTKSQDVRLANPEMKHKKKRSSRSTRKCYESQSTKAKPAKDSMEGSERLEPEVLQPVQKDCRRGPENERDTDLTLKERAEKNKPYDLYGAVMNVVEKHRQNRMSLKKAWSAPLKGQELVKSAKFARQKDSSYSVSDDEDLSSEISVVDQSGRGHSRSSSSDSTHNQDTSESSFVEKRRLRQRKGKSSKGSVLLGSNMLPNVHLERCTIPCEDLPASQRTDANGNAAEQRANLEDGYAKDRALEEQTVKSEGSTYELEQRCGNAESTQKTFPDSGSECHHEETPKAWTIQQTRLSHRRKEEMPDRSQEEREKGPRDRISRKKLTGQPSGADEGVTEWPPDELNRLQRALKVIPPSSQHFWSRVAGVVGTRTGWECQQVHQAKLEATTRPSRKPRAVATESQSTAKEPVALTAAKGTRRRKRQMMEFIEQHNKNHSDDLFDSTPFKKQKVTKKNLANLALEEAEPEPEAEEEEDGRAGGAGGGKWKTPGSDNMMTPSARLHALLAPLSTKKTPHSTIVSPGLLRSVEKKHVDQYIHGIQKRRPTVRKRTKKTPEKSQDVVPRQVKSKDVNMTSIFQVDPVHDSDNEDGERDYYWSDEDQS